MVLKNDMTYIDSRQVHSAEIKICVRVHNWICHGNSFKTEFILQRLWSSRSDVWSFGVTLWEIFSYCQEPPLADLTDEQIVENLKHWFHSDGFHLTPSRPSMHQCTKEMFDLIKQCWSREPEERPLFVEIHQFLQNKCLGFTVD